MGMKWGENGYGKIIVQVDKDATSGCGLLKEIYFPYEWFIHQVNDDELLFVS